MSDTGILNAASCSEDSGIGTRSWANLSNAVGAQNGSVTSCDLSGGFSNISKYFVGAITHGLSAGDTINGIVAAAYWSATKNDSEAPRDTSVKVVKNGTVSGNNKAVNNELPQAGAWSADYGANNDTWGLSLTGADTIGVAFAFLANDPNDTVSIDAIRVTIYYTPSGGTSSSKAFFLMME